MYIHRTEKKNLHIVKKCKSVSQSGKYFVNNNIRKGTRLGAGGGTV